MGMLQQRRRVSYVIPPPVESVPRLQLPPHGTSRLGSTGPLLIPLRKATEAEPHKLTKHPRHRLGISSLALDTSTQLAGRAAPEGILYSAGRDGLVISWDLGISMKKRKVPHNSSLRWRDWEAMTGWADKDELDDLVQSDGDILGDVTIYHRRRQKINSQVIPYEKQWETELAAYKPGKATSFRQCAQFSSDWINDILLCNNQQTVISASSDGTIKSWSPHLPNSPYPTTIGTHADYVRCLTHSREQNWVASGSFDRTIKLWDLTREGQVDPLVTFSPPDTNAPKSSIYAIAADPFGTTIASGSPERVIRLWDPRTGKRTGKLVGHTDNIRAMLMSEDAKYLLTGSADASIKLWSLSTQRCLHTFTHHTESVWSLYSSHPTLEVFYSGDRSGLVCRVDVEGCSDVSEGECILLCQDGDPSAPSSDGINKIVVMDDNLLWTASGHSNIKRWSVPQRRSVRASSNTVLDLDRNRYGRSESSSPHVSQLPSEMSTRPSSSTAHGLSGSMAPSMQSLASDTWPPPFERDDKQVHGIPFESLVRLISPNEVFNYSSGRGRDPEVATLYSAASIKSIPRQTLIRSSTFPTSKPPLQRSRTEDVLHPMSTARADYEERELASDAVPLRAQPEDVLVGDHGLVRSMILNDRVHALTIDTSGEVAVWDIVRGICRGRFSREDVAAISHTESWAGGGGGEKEHSPREVLEAVRERIEGEAVVSHWAMADTKAGVLTIHLTEKCFEAEVYADEVGYANDRRFNDESKINLGKWVLRNLFLGFIREEQRMHRGQESESPPDNILNPSLSRANNAHSRKPEAMFTNSPVVRSPHMVPALPPTAAPPTRSSPLMTSLIPLHTKEMTTDEGDSTPLPTSGTSVGDYSTIRGRQPSAPGQSTVPASPDDYSGWVGKSDNSGQSSIMGRWKNFGKARRPQNEASITPFMGLFAPSAALTTAPEGVPRTIDMNIVKSPTQAILSGPISPPSSSESPTYALPPNTAISISEEALPSYMTVYRGTVANTKHDVQVLEGAMPLWLLEYLLLNKIPTIPPHQKISFVLLPCPMPDGEEQLPEFLNTTQSKLTSSRYLRVRKLAAHVQEKLEKLLSRPGEGPHEKTQSKSLVEDELEILCNDVVLHLNMSLAVVRQYIWKQSSELTMYYRRKLPTDRPREIKSLSHTSDL